MKAFIKGVSTLYVVTLVGVLLYSFTQVDLGLTLSKVPLFHAILQKFQYVGYFTRPISTYLYMGVLIAFFISYVGLIIVAKKKLISEKLIWILSFLTVGILLFSYNAFSYDLFNYIFDAKIFTHYHLNPYLFKALDFPGDPMLAFMHWTHRTYPYGPVWLGITIPLSFLGMNVFVPTMILFKSLMAGSFLGSVYMIRKISKLISPKTTVLSMVLFACNPLIIIESLVSSHQDVVMIFLSFVAVYFLLRRNYLRACLFLFLSIGIKYATVFLLPIFLVVWFLQWKKKKIDWEWVFTISGVVMVPAIILATLRANFQPWYLLFSLPYVLLGKKHMWVYVTAIVMPIAVLLEYVPYLFLGNWDPPVPMILSGTTLSGIVLTILLSGISYLVIWQKNVVK